MGVRCWSRALPRTRTLALCGGLVVALTATGAATIAGASSAALPPGCSQSGQTVTCSYGPADSPVLFTVPSAVGQAFTFSLRGGKGGDGGDYMESSEPPSSAYVAGDNADGGGGGDGGLTTATRTRTAGSKLDLRVGDAGRPGEGCSGVAEQDPQGGNGGELGGAQGGDGHCAAGGGGGGTFVSAQGADLAAGEALLAAGGGGGGGGAGDGQFGGKGGKGGGSTEPPGNGDPGETEPELGITDAGAAESNSHLAGTGAAPAEGGDGGTGGGSEAAFVFGDEGQDEGDNGGGGGGGGGGYNGGGGGRAGSSTDGGGGGGGGSGFPAAPSSAVSGGSFGAARADLAAAPGDGQLKISYTQPTTTPPSGGGGGGSGGGGGGGGGGGKSKVSESAKCKAGKVCVVSPKAGKDSKYRIKAFGGNGKAVLKAKLKGGPRPNCPDYREYSRDWVQFRFKDPLDGLTWTKKATQTTRDKMSKRKAKALKDRIQACVQAPYLFLPRHGYRQAHSGPAYVAVVPECSALLAGYAARRGLAFICVAERKIVRKGDGWVVRITIRVPPNRQDPSFLG